MHMVGFDFKQSGKIMDSGNKNGEPVPPLGEGEIFYFACGPQVPCFNECCRDLNQFLTPYDVLRLARHMQMSSGDFLRAYTSTHTGPRTGLPVVCLEPVNGGQKQCPFVTPHGCRVYENRPASCRMYPLARVLRKSRRDGHLCESYALIREDHCRGFEQDRPMTVGRWIADQGLVPYNAFNDAMIDVISAARRHRPGPLGGELGRKLFFALYDIDGFRAGLVNGELLGDCRRMGLQVDPAAEAGPVGDGALLRLAMQYAAGTLCQGAGRRFPDPDHGRQPGM